MHEMLELTINHPSCEFTRAVQYKIRRTSEKKKKKGLSRQVVEERKGSRCFLSFIN